MNQNNLGRKWRHGSASVGITALVIALVILLNLGLSLFTSATHGFIDMTPNTIYTLSSTAKNLLKSTIDEVNAASKDGEEVAVDIIFCADPDILCATANMRYVYYTALAFERVCPDNIRVSTIDVWDNPSAADPYRSNTYADIYQSNIIVSSGSEYRVMTLKSFFIVDSEDGSEPWAYDGVRKFMSAIIAVTRTEAPICALTYNHGEPFDGKTGETEYTEFISLLEGAGYEVVFLDLEKEEIPENCRLVITFDPQKDFASSYLGGSVSEISKLEKFINAGYSYLTFFDADTPKLPVLEEYLEEWGITIGRYEKDGVSATLELTDNKNAVDATGSYLIGQYAAGGGGVTMISDLRESGGSPKVVFGNAVPLTYSTRHYEIVYNAADATSGSAAYHYATDRKFSSSRMMFQMFGAGSDAYVYARANGERLTEADGTDKVIGTYDAQNPYHLLTVSTRNHLIGEGQGFTSANDISYVLAVGSTAFASNEMLSSDAYGNADVLLMTLRSIGSEIVPVGVEFILLYEDSVAVSNFDAAFNTTATVVLVLIPAFAMAIAGVYVLTRRRLSH